MDLKIIKFREIDSTNEYSKKLDLDINSTRYIISDIQIKGKGRVGRDFLSSDGGLYLSIVKDDLKDVENLPFITQVAAVSIYKSLEEFGIFTYIKWPNDIILKDKKLAGILTEVVSIGKSLRIICGIGMNISNNVKNIETATSLFSNGFYIEKEQLLEKIIEKFENYFEKFVRNELEEIIKILNDNSYVIGKEIMIYEKNSSRKANVLKIKKDGSLLVSYIDGRVESITSGEVSIRTK